jgi:putative outer membrane protein, probably involved in nutrient binding
MKKVIFSLLAVSSMLIGCRDEDKLLNSSAQSYVSQDQLSELITKFPEKASFVTSGFESGNNKYMIAFGGAHERFGYMSILLGMEFMTNDVAVSSSAYPHFVTTYYPYRSRDVDHHSNQWVWTFYYKVVYNMNLVLNSIPSASSDANANHIRGRALAMRALAYFDLVRLYGADGLGIPYYSQSVNSNARVSSSTVMGYIETDLKEAYSLLAGYTRSDKQSIDKKVVSGFLARYYMETKNYTLAAQYANEARQGYSPMSATQLMDGFDDISNPEWMWGADIDGSTSNIYASFFSHMSNMNRGYAGLAVRKMIDKRLYDKISSTDYRKQWFLGSDTNVTQIGATAPVKLPQYSNLKFQDASGSSFVGDYVYMRAAEMYFIEAEAYARLGNNTQAQDVLYDIMSKRDPSYVKSTSTGNTLLEEIMVNKRIELWGEGQNFFDQKRWGISLDRIYTGTNHISSGQLNIPAGDSKFNFMIPQAELDANKSVSNP